MGQEWIERALKAIPFGASTFAKSPLNPVRAGIKPLFATAGSGSYFIDQDNNRWLDIDMGMGSVIWGHSCPELIDAIMSNASNGINFSVPSTLEIILAEKILERYEKYEQILFSKNGSDATSAAIRIARAATGRKDIVLGSYHGWHDWSNFHRLKNIKGRGGIPKEVGKHIHWLSSEHFDSLLITTREMAKSPAAIIVCPEHWLKDELILLRNHCTQSGILLIFDEIKSSLRYGKTGVGGALGIKPDLLCIGKGLANGMPLAALMGNREIMAFFEQVKVSSTHFGEILSLSVALASENLLSQRSTWPSWKEQSEHLIREINLEIQRSNLTDVLKVTGNHGIFALEPLQQKDITKFRVFFNSNMQKKGIFSRGWVVMSDAHHKVESDRILNAVMAILNDFSKNKIYND